MDMYRVREIGAPIVVSNPYVPATLPPKGGSRLTIGGNLAVGSVKLTILWMSKKVPWEPKPAVPMLVPFMETVTTA